MQKSIHRRSVLAGGIVTTLLVLLVLLLSVSAVARSQIICESQQGVIERGTYRSAIAETNMYYSVYTPPCYAEITTPYPVLYLMHGSNDDDGQWGRLGIQAVLDEGINNGTLPPMIVIMPFGEWIANQNQFDVVSWENVFLQELMPLVESQYQVDARRETRAIGGISRGGFWAFEIAFRHPDLFSIVGGHSAFFAEGNAPPDFDPLKLAQNASGLDSLRIWLDRGKDDYARPGLDLMRERLAARGLPHDYTIYAEGQHNNDYWRQHVSDYLAFYAAGWTQTVVIPTPPPIVFATNTPNDPAPTAVAQAAPDEGWMLFVPAVAFPSLQTSISSLTLAALRIGRPEPKLVLDTTTVLGLGQLGVSVDPSVQIVNDDALLNLLWRDGSLITLLAFDRLTPRYRVLSIDGLHPLDFEPGVYPFMFKSETANFYPARLTRLLMSGVTALTRRTRTALDEKGVAWAAEGIKPYVEQADFFHTSNEVSFSPRCPGWDAQPLGEFCSKQEHFELFSDLGLEIVELTGNHNNDFGTENYLTTLGWYRERGIRLLGGGDNLEQARQPLILDHHGNRVALVACNWIGPYYALAGEDAPGAADCNWDWFRATLPTLAAENDVLIVSVQYLEIEYYRPSARQISDFQGLADLGADIVIGTQAHKPQTMAFYNTSSGTEAFLHYGLGNLFFDQPFWGNSRFFMDELFIYEGRLLTVDLFTGIIDDLARPRPMTTDEQRNFLAFMFNTQGAF